MSWDRPDLRGRRAIVTGGTSGVGFHVVRFLVAHGADVVLTSRDAARAQKAAETLRALAASGSVQGAVLDLGDLGTIRRFASAHVASPLHLLINNAGVMGFPRRRSTVDGFEMQFGVNHLGHFALTLLLLQALRGADAARVVTVASIAHRRARLNLDDLQSARHYRPRAAYAQSKLANLLFAQELDRRLERAGTAARSLAAHPGLAATAITDGMLEGAGVLRRAVVQGGFRLLAQDAAAGALPIVRAAVDTTIGGFAYLGPAGWGEFRGPPGFARRAPQARDAQAAAALWVRSEELTGVDGL